MIQIWAKWNPLEELNGCSSSNDYRGAGLIERQGGNKGNKSSSTINFVEYLSFNQNNVLESPFYCIGSKIRNQMTACFSLKSYIALLVSRNTFLE